jgi:hypothetical protein
MPAKRGREVGGGLRPSFGLIINGPGTIESGVIGAAMTVPACEHWYNYQNHVAKTDFRPLRSRAGCHQ